MRQLQAKEKLRKAEERRAFRESRVFQEARSIGGVLNVVSVFRHSKRDIFLKVYNPENGDSKMHFNFLYSCTVNNVDVCLYLYLQLLLGYQFTMRKEVLKEYLERSLNTGSLSNNELFIKSNMRLLSDQLMYRNRMNDEGIRHKVIVLSEKGGGERGKLCARKGKMISYGNGNDGSGSGTGCIVSVFQYFKDFIFKAHNVDTCEMMRTTLTDVQLKGKFSLSILFSLFLSFSLFFSSQIAC